MRCITARPWEKLSAGLVVDVDVDVDVVVVVVVVIAMIAVGAGGAPDCVRDGDEELGVMMSGNAFVVVAAAAGLAAEGCCGVASDDGIGVA